MAPRREPERTCVGCRRKEGKRVLTRLVRAADGRVHVDPSGKAPGRGAYVHPDPACWNQATRHGALARALRTSLPAAELDRLRGAMEMETR